LACFGLLMTLILLAPTSSIVPIADPLVERRMYLPLVGLILMACEFAGRVRVSRSVGYGAVTVVLIVYAALCYQRNQLWSQPSRLWELAATQATTNVRPYANLVDELIQERQCGRAIPYLQQADRAFPNNYSVQMSWGRALECLGRRNEALQHLLRASALQPCSYVYQLIGLLYGEMGKNAEAGLALQKAVDSDPRSVAAHDAFGLWYETVANRLAAEKEYRTSLALDPNDRAARVGIARVVEASIHP
jgi:tetratricopeptide (TPR) repeat protein